MDLNVNINMYVDVDINKDIDINMLAWADEWSLSVGWGGLGGAAGSMFT